MPLTQQLNKLQEFLAMALDLRTVGGIQTVMAGGDPSDPAAVTWNFGLAPKTAEVEADAGPQLYSALPNVQGKWDGKTSINHHNAVRQVLGKDLPAQYQRIGCCASRAGSRGLEILQCILMAAGKRAKFHSVSHSWIYYIARREYGMLGGGDGAASGCIPPVLAKYGAVTREEDGDLDADGPHTDDICKQWGAGRISSDDVKKYTELASDNIITLYAKVNSAQELADGIASGGVGIGSDSQGYTMTRDSDGFCSPHGTWYHYHVRSGVRVTPSGRKGFDYNQSWGENTPDGPLLPDCPSNCFGVDWDVQDHCCKTGDWHVVYSFSLWDLQNTDINMPWVF